MLRRIEKIFVFFALVMCAGLSVHADDPFVDHTYELDFTLGKEQKITIVDGYGYGEYSIDIIVKTIGKDHCVADVVSEQYLELSWINSLQNPTFGEGFTGHSLIQSPTMMTLSNSIDRVMERRPFGISTKEIDVENGVCTLAISVTFKKNAKDLR